ncbi:F-box only protein 34 [Ambystoma mexicanum]|uniref:F-box only protein 34 n=1 Tax=Ambystoma mexicanum TaxID=8296 RepID=UPI0037E70A11
MDLKPDHKLPNDLHLKLDLNTRTDHVGHQTVVNDEESTTRKPKLACTHINVSYHKPFETICQAMMIFSDGKGTSNSLVIKENVNAFPVMDHHGEEVPLDTHAIKPGNTKEIISLFASNKNRKAKSTWDIVERSAKRRKTSKLEAKNPVVNGANKNSHPFEPLACSNSHCSEHFVEGSNAVFCDGSLSVIHTVAFIEQWGSTLLLDSTKTLRNSCTASEHDDGGNETMSVLDRVAQIEAECLKHRDEHNGSSISRNNRFRRHVGSMLLASTSNSDNEEENVSSETSDFNSDIGNSLYRNQSNSSSSCTLSEDDQSPVPFQMNLLTEVNLYMPCLELETEQSLKTGRFDIEINTDPFSACLNVVDIVQNCLRTENADSTAEDTTICAETVSDDTEKAATELVYTSVSPKFDAQTNTFKVTYCDDTLPGTLFCHPCNDQSCVACAESSTASFDGLQGIKPFKTANLSLYSAPSVVASVVVSTPHLDSGPRGVHFSLKRHVSPDFRQIKSKIQRLLGPVDYMALLPHHLIVHLFSFLPTKSLAALKCTCQYFKFMIEYYDIRPVDSLWVRDVRYKYDPCKQCKKKYVKGDVSLCWWHPKYYCQSFPHGPGYWLCCHRPYKDSPACKVGLHDNRWISSCQGYNRPV